LAKVLERPVKLTEFTWTVNSAVKTTIDPWTLWQSDSFVKSKLENFAFLRCNLHVRIVPSATPFQYGRLMVNYVPYGDNNEIWYNNYNTLYGSGASGSVEAYMQYVSTYPISGLIDPAENNVLEMKLPFIYHKNFLPIAGDADDAKVSLGKLAVVDLNTLSIANPDATTTMNVAVFAWATDVELYMPTDFTPTAGGKVRRKVKFKEQGVEECEAEDGIVSAPASTIANIAGKLTNVPVIGNFARATEIGANAVGSVARLFGFSNPPSVVNPQPRVLRLYRNLANVVTEDTAIKMSMDPNQELTIDPRIAGWGTNDDMVLSSIVKKEQWLTKAKWLGTTGQFVTAGTTGVILATVVSPINVRATGTYGAAPTRQALQPSPAGHIGHLFKYWKGKVVYRIEVVCSKYHAGALQIQFDPFIKNGAVAATDVPSTSVNTRQTVIMNIAETQSMEFEIDFINHNPFLKCRDITTSTMTPSSYSDTTFALHSVYSQDTDLGMLTVTILNELTAPGTVTSAPGSGAGVDVNLYCRCDEDLVFAQTIGGWENDYFVPTSGLTQWEKKVMVDTADTANDLLTCFGEKMPSVRSILKRPTIVMFNVANTGDAQTTGEQVTMSFPHFAPETLRTDPLNRRNCYESYLAPAYLAKRGAMRWKVYVYAGNSVASDASGTLLIERQVSDSTVAGAPSTGVQNFSVPDTIMDLFPSGSQGMDITDLRYKPCVDIECPFYSNTRFTLACNITNMDTSSQLLKNPSMEQILYEKVTYAGYSAGKYRYVVHVSVGEDYNLICYQAPPTHWLFT